MVPPGVKCGRGPYHRKQNGVGGREEPECVRKAVRQSIPSRLFCRRPIRLGRLREGWAEVANNGDAPSSISDHPFLLEFANALGELGDGLEMVEHLLPRLWQWRPRLVRCGTLQLLCLGEVPDATIREDADSILPHCEFRNIYGLLVVYRQRRHLHIRYTPPRIAKWM